MIKIKKASAGSGKTYQLTETYLDCLAASGDQNAYRHILAVTFTNKATAEMKSRILKRLHQKAADDPESERLLVSILKEGERDVLGASSLAWDVKEYSLFK